MPPSRPAAPKPRESGPARERVAEAAAAPTIYVLAGTNGAGKSSIAGAMFEQSGVEYFNPDRAARRILARNPGITQETANSVAWHEGARLLERALVERCNFSLETTLGGRTIAARLEAALAAGIDVRVWYVGLSTLELHVKRVRARVARGGHDIPDDAIRKRFDSSRLNLIRLLPALTELRMYDNSAEADPHKGRTPLPRLILHVIRGKVRSVDDLAAMPAWAKPIVVAALRTG
jgi:predicted ABC-type ATPase